jgi:hypothetical protein
MPASHSSIELQMNGDSTGRRNPVLLVICVGYAAMAISMSLIFFAVLARNSLPVGPSTAGFALMAGISVALGIASWKSTQTGKGNQQDARKGRWPRMGHWFAGVKRDLVVFVMLGTGAGIMILQYFEGRPRQADSLPIYFCWIWINLLYGIGAFVRWRRPAQTQ